MKILIRFFLVLGSLLLAPSDCQANTLLSEGQISDDHSFNLIQVKRFKVVNVTTAAAAMLLQDRLPIRMAIEAIPCKGVSLAEVTRKISLDLQDTTIPHVLDAITAANPIFKWQVEKNGLIRVFPKACAADPGYTLNRIIPSFRAVGVSLDEAFLKLITQIRTKDPKFVIDFHAERINKDTFGQIYAMNIVRENISVRDIISLMSAKYSGSWAIFRGVFPQKVPNMPTLLFANPFNRPFFNLPQATLESSVVEFEGVDSEYENLEWWDPSRNDYVLDISTKVQIKKLVVKELPVVDVMAFLGETFHFRYSFEGIPNEKVVTEALMKPVSLEISDASLSDVRERLVAATRKTRVYRATFSNGFLTAYPLLADADKTYLMTQTIPLVRITNQEHLPALTALAAQMSKLVPGIKVVNGVKDIQRDAEGDAVLINLVARNTTPRRVLFRLGAKAQDSWIILPSADGKTLNIQSGKKYFAANKERIEKSIELERY